MRPYPLVVFVGVLGCAAGDSTRAPAAAGSSSSGSPASHAASGQPSPASSRALGTGGFGNVPTGPQQEEGSTGDGSSRTDGTAHTTGGGGQEPGPGNSNPPVTGSEGDTQAAYAAAADIVALTSRGATTFDLVRVRDSWPLGQGVVGHLELGGVEAAVYSGASGVDRINHRYFFESTNATTTANSLTLQSVSTSSGTLTQTWHTGELAGFAYDPATRLVFGLQYDGVAAGSAFFTSVDPDTGTLVHIANLTGMSTKQGVQTVDPGHRYFVVLGGAQDTSTVVGLDLSTGQEVDRISTVELVAIAFDGARNVLMGLHASRAAAGLFDVVELDLATGTLTSLVSVASGGVMPGAHAYNAATGHFFFAGTKDDGITRLQVVDTRNRTVLGAFQVAPTFGMEFAGQQFPPM